MAWERGRGQPSVQRAQNLIVNEAGEFSAPASLNGVEYESMLAGASAYASEPQSFVFDEEPAWDEPLALAPDEPPEESRAGASAVSGRPSRPPRPSGHRHGGARAYGYVAVICLSLAGVLVLGPRVIPVLRKLKFGQTVYELGPQSHKTKQGTPTMGGLMFVLTTCLAAAVFTGNWYGKWDFTLALIGVSLLTMLVGMVLFQERFKPSGYVGLVLLLGGILALNLL